MRSFKFSRSIASFLGAVLALTLMNGASARVRTVIREPFNGTGVRTPASLARHRR